MILTYAIAYARRDWAKAERGGEKRNSFKSDSLVNAFTKSLIRKSLGIIHRFHLFILFMAPFNTIDDKLNVLKRDSVSYKVLKIMNSFLLYVLLCAH